MADRIQDILPFEHKNTPSFYSDIYNTGTLMQFSSERHGLDDQKSSFLKVHYRIKNLQLVNKLENTTFADHDHIKKVCKGLSCCSSVSEIQVTTRNNATIAQTSKKCKRPFCPRCNQIQASKYKRRFIKCYNAPENEKLFKGKYFYFITLTLKHDTKGTRTEIYLDELKALMTEFRRSKIWKKHFPYSTKNPQSGFVQSYELTLTDNGYHIHSHILMCAPPLKGAVKKIEQDFREAWLNRTGDSNGFRLDLIKMDEEEIKKVREGKPSKKLTGILSETFKYTVKLGNLHRLPSNKAEMFAKWIIATKGKNMITSNGFFRQYKLQLFTRKSRWDETEEEEEPQEELTRKDHMETWKYFVGKTSQINFNHQKNRHYPKEEREHILSTVYLKSIPGDFVDISEGGDFFNTFLNELLNPQENEYGTSDIDMLPIWAESAKRNKEEEKHLQAFLERMDKRAKKQAQQDIIKTINGEPITKEWLEEIHLLYQDTEEKPGDIIQLFLFDDS